MTDLRSRGRRPAFGARTKARRNGRTTAMFWVQLVAALGGPRALPALAHAEAGAGDARPTTRREKAVGGASAGKAASTATDRRAGGGASFSRAGRASLRG